MPSRRRVSDSKRALLVVPALEWQAAFLAAVRRSRELHARWAAPPRNEAQYRAFVQRAQDPRHFCHFVCTHAGELAGVININEVIRGAAQFGYLGYYAFAPHAGSGWMRQGIALVLQKAFGTYRLHRLEANIQPDNARSIALVHGLGFRCEGYSAGYLKLAGRWRDHERWAITRELWKATQRRKPHA